MAVCCRLCLRNDKLQSVFDLDASGNIAEVVKITCGVEIKTTDRISQMICDTCYKITLKMYKFRSISIKNNESLLGEINTASKSSSSPVPTIPAPIKCPKPKNDLHQKRMHPSIRNILKTYPNITLPRQMHLDHHFGPCITLLTTETSHWQTMKKRPHTESTSTPVQNKKAKVVETKPESHSVKLTKIKVSDLKPESHSPKITKEDSTPQKKHIPTLQELLKCIGKDKKDAVKSTKKINVLECLVLGVSKSQENIAENSNSVSPKNNTESSVSKESSLENGVSARKEKIAENSVSKENIPENNVGQGKISSTPQEKLKTVQHDSSQVTTIRSPSKVDVIQTIEEEQSSGSSDRLQIDLDDNSNENISREKSDFVKSLALVPTTTDSTAVVSQSTHLDDTLLLSHINKSQTLLSCKICNTWYCTSKQLKIHQKKVHTKCPFCGKKFRTLETKNVHDLYECGKTCAKKIGVRLILERIDQNKEIVEKYPYAFSKSIEISDSPKTNNQVENESSIPVDVKEIIDVENRDEVDLTAENNENSSGAPSSDKRRSSYVDNGLKLTLKQTDGRYVIVNDDCIYVSDEDDDCVVTTPAVKPTINLHNNPILKKVSNEDSVTLLQKLLTEISTKENNSLPNSYKFRIKDTTTKKCKLLKDHGELLKKGNIPVELSYGRDLSVGHKCVHSNVNYEPKHLWYNVSNMDWMNKSVGKVMPTNRELRPKAGESSKVILNSSTVTSVNSTSSSTITKFQNTPNGQSSISSATSSYINFRIKTAAQSGTTPVPSSSQSTTTSTGFINLTINNPATRIDTPPASQVFSFNPTLQNTSTPIAPAAPGRSYIIPGQSTAIATSNVVQQHQIPPLQPITPSTLPRILLTAPNTTATLPVTVRNFLLLPTNSQCVALDNGTEVVQQQASTSTAPIQPRMQSTIRVKNIIELS